MSTITIPKKEYQKLVETRLRYEYLRKTMEEDIFISPPTRNKGKILAEFERNPKYNLLFLEGLKRGLERSTYFKS